MEKLKGKKPSIRFPEFKDEWEKFYLGELVYKTDKKNKENLNLPVYSINNTSGFVQQDEQFEGRNSQERGFDISIYKIINSKTFAYNPARINVGSIGYSYDLENVLVSSLYVCFKTTENLDDIFLLHFLNTSSFKISVLRIQEGGVRQYLFFENLSKIKISVPSLPEQTRIAAFFTVVDKKIAELKQKKTLLEQYKKGVMQKLFSQELRFKDDNGKEFPKWEKKRLGNVATFFSGGTPVTTKKSYYEGDIPFIKSGEINSDKTEQFITEEGLKNSSAKMVETGDLLYALYGATSGEAGISKIKGAINQAVLCIRTKSFNKIFLLNYLQFEKTAIVGKYLQGGQGNLSADIVKSLIVSTPCSAEQDKISDFLSAIDEKINRTEKQIQQAQEWKKGLLQNMFV